MKLLGGVVPLVSWHPFIKTCLAAVHTLFSDQTQNSDYRDSNTAHQVSTNETQLTGCIYPLYFFIPYRGLCCEKTFLFKAANP